VPPHGREWSRSSCRARPSARVRELEEILRATASQAGQPDNLLGWGIVDASRAVQAITR
jgi:hypothetical protein